MNIKINKQQHEWLESEFEDFSEYLFGSRLLGVNTEESDFDYLRLISDDFYYLADTPAKFLPNIHAFQYTEGKEAQYLWMTESQFWKNFFSGDGSVLTDIILFTENHPFGEPLNLCYTYKVIKGLLGVTKRDLKRHKDWKKRIAYSEKSLYMAECLMNKELPDLKTVQNIIINSENVKILDDLKARESKLRNKLNDMLNKNEITFYPRFKENIELFQLLAESNNIKEFRYE